jgi:hypothetical protein
MYQGCNVENLLFPSRFGFDGSYQKQMLHAFEGIFFILSMMMIH